MESRELFSQDEFLTFSARLNYLLSSSHPSYEAISNKITGDRPFDGSAAVMEDGVAFLVRAYQNRWRALGPKGVLHPLRVAHIVSLAKEAPHIVDYLTVFLHDYYEDIYTPDLPEEDRREMEWRLEALLENLKPREQEDLLSRMRVLTCGEQETYNEYLGRLLAEVPETPELLWIKLADRLDNTMDMRVVESGSSEFFRLIFDSLFLKRTRHQTMKQRPPAGQMSESKRLYQMFKNAIFLTLVRRAGHEASSDATLRLFGALAHASLLEAGRILKQVFQFYITDPEHQRHILVDAMEYCVGGGIERVTPSERGNKLDGLFKERFDHANRKTRREVLAKLQNDKDMMASAALAFISVFENFLTSASFQLGGIHITGISFDDTFV